MQTVKYFTWILIGANLISPETAAAQNQRLKDVEKIWAAQRQEVATAYIRCRTFRTGSVNPLTHEEVVRLFKSVDLAANPDTSKRSCIA